MFGKGQNSNSIISQLDFAIKNNQKVFYMSGGEQLRDYLPVEKAAEKLFDYIKAVKGIFNICSGKPISIRNLQKVILRKRILILFQNMDIILIHFTNQCNFGENRPFNNYFVLQ